MPQKFRAFIFTRNSTWDLYSLQEISGCRFLCQGKEISPSTGRRHVQGFCYFTSAKSISSVIRLLSGCHVEVMRSPTFAAAIAYCKKDGDFVEEGVAPVDRGEAEADRWEQALILARESKIESIPADIQLRYYGNLKRIERDQGSRPPNLTDVCGFWIHGESGAGKTRNVVSVFPDAYDKPRNKWWCGYNSEDIVLVDDMDIYDVGLGGLLKHWADFKAFSGETKGGSKLIRPKKVIVTSQYTIEEIWTDAATRAALNRRFKVLFKNINVNYTIEHFN
jgi:hypothetical protein